MPKKEKTLAEVMPSETDQLRLEVSNLNAKVYEITEEIKKTVGELALDMNNLNERVSAAAEIIHDVQSKYDAAISAMAEVRQLQALQDIATSLEGIHQIKKAYADKMNGREADRKQVKQDNTGHTDKPKPATPNGRAPPTHTSIKTALEEKGVNTSLIAISVDQGLAIITPIKFLGDMWGPINTAVRDLGGGWIRDGKQSRWEIKGAAA